MAVTPRIAPFINTTFYITSKWWNERINPVTGVSEIHRGLDIATGDNDTVYSMLTGIVHSLGTSSSRGNWIIIKDNNSNSATYGYATLYMHLASLPTFNVGDSVTVGQAIGIEGMTGQSTGIHLHVEMQDLNRFNNVWTATYNRSDYIDVSDFMGIPNVEGTECFYDGTPYIPTPTPITKSKKSKYKFYLFKRKF